MKTVHSEPSKSADNKNYSYSYIGFRERLIGNFDSYYFSEESIIAYEANNAELISYGQVLEYVKTDLLPFFESIFNFNLFDNYEKSKSTQGINLGDSLHKEFIQFIYTEANKIAFVLDGFKKGNKEFFESYTDFENNVIKSIFLYVFQNTRFTGSDKKYLLNADSNKFIKDYLNTILIDIREKPKAICSRLLQLEINRVKTLILKNANFNFLNWYQSELKSALYDLKFIYKSQPNYGLNCSIQKLTKLYLELARYDFIDVDHTPKTDFINVFIKDWYSHDSICVLKMDNPQTKYFLNHFKVHLDSKLTMAAIEKAKNITNNSGYIISSSLSASSSRNKLIGPKREQDLLDAFKGVKG